MSKQPSPSAPTTDQEAGPVATRQAVDWERIELDYRAGIKTLRQIAEEHGITHGAINKRAKRDGWERDLEVKIQAKADALVSKAAVSSEVSTDTKIRERAVIDANAQAVADVRLGHRKDVHRARGLMNRLMDELEQQTDPATLAKLQELAAAVVSPDEKPGRDRFSELLEAVISLPERSKTMKMMVESLQKLVDMERQAYGIRDDGGGSEGGEQEFLERLLNARARAANR